ncbi:hypothetical protein C1645_840386 [Glomus cerebriforme]|uniref:Retrotransposon gag domain-containing protein n=1 Tax=Glomus cerebriforme TaxID=658196 RepID=A0A397RZG7_9GLOM|nr:hypothetical protein C1645_840386 [Glomus cerebriforme]
MATKVQMARLLKRVHGLLDGALNNVLAARESMAKRIANAGNEAGMLNMPLFSRREDENISDWVRQFEVVFTAMGKAAGTNVVRQAAYAATCLGGVALQWYNEMKEANVGNLVNWTDNDNDNDLKHRIKQRFT